MKMTEKLSLRLFEGSDKFDYKVVNENFKSIDSCLSTLSNDKVCVLTEADKLEIAEIISREYPTKVHRNVTPFTAVKDSNPIITPISYEEGEI